MLNIEEFESQSDSVEIEKHFLAAAYNHLCFGFGEQEWIDKFMSLPKSREIFSDIFNRHMFDCLQEELLTFHEAPTNDITVSTRLKNICGCAANVAENYIDDIVTRPVEKDLDLWKDKIVPIWHFHNSRSRVKDCLRNSLELVSKSCNIKESQVALSYILNAAQLIEGAETYKDEVHPFVNAKEVLLGPKLVNRVIKTRFSFFNSALGGGLNHPSLGSDGRLIVVAGRPGSGKSTWAMNLALDVAMKDSKVLFYTLEMSNMEVCQRMLSCLDYLLCLDQGGEPLTYGHVIRQIKNVEQEQRIKSIPIEKIADNFIFANTYNVTPSQMVTRIKSEKRKNKNLALVVIDYLTLMDLDSDSTKSETRALAIGAATRKLKTVALQAGVDILAVCQLNRGVEARDNKRPMLSDLRESGRIEEDADAVIMNYWPWYYNKNEDSLKYEYSVVKNRKGPTGTSEILFAKEYYSMTESAAEY
jgi:replicative DNA helicase